MTLTGKKGGASQKRQAGVELDLLTRDKEGIPNIINSMFKGKNERAQHIRAGALRGMRTGLRGWTGEVGRSLPVDISYRKSVVLKFSVVGITWSVLFTVKIAGPKLPENLIQLHS